MKKRIISLLLAVVMIVGMLPLGAITAFADGKDSTHITGSTSVHGMYGTYFTGDYAGSVFKVTGTPPGNGVNFANITFENITCGENGACVYIDVDWCEEWNGWHHETHYPGNITFTNCRFINCSTTGNGGAVYINGSTEKNSIIFNNCTFINCSAEGDGGAIYVNDSDAKVDGKGNTVISACSAGVDGGGVYMEHGKEIDGFILADNTAKKGDGGGICNLSNSAEISNCRFYRNTCGGGGGGLYTDKATVENCKFFENDCSDDGYELSTNSGSTQIKNCTFTSNYSGDNVVYGGTQSNCTFPDKSSYQLTVGDGSKENPYLIRSTDDWDALHYVALKRVRMYPDGTEHVYGNEYSLYGKYIRLDADITVCNTVGEAHDNATIGGAVLSTSYSEFNGIFDGNGHTVTYVSCIDLDRNGVFGYANSATVKNLTVNGYIKGRNRVGGLFGSTYNCTAENCTNNATVYGKNDCVGGIAGHSECSNYIGCTNNGKVEGAHEQIGGIVGYSNGDTVNGCVNNGDVVGSQKCGGIVGVAHETDSLINGEHRAPKILNCINNATVTATYSYGGGIIGYEDGKVTAENCINTGKVNADATVSRYPAEGDYVIYAASDNKYCFDIQGGAEGLDEYRNLQLWTAQTSGAKVFTLKYYDKYDAYAIIAKHSGLALTADPKKDYSTVDWVNVYQFTNQPVRYQLWTFEPDNAGSCKIRSLESGFTMNVANGTACEGASIIAYKYGGNDSFSLVAEPNQVLKSVYANGITGRHFGGSTYEQCLYDKDKAVGDRFGIGLSDNAMKGISADTVGGKSYIMPNAINDYIKQNNKEEDGWVPAYLNNNKQLAFHTVGWSRYLDDKGNVVEVENFIEITSETQTLTTGTYIVEGDVTVNHRIHVSGNSDVLIILADNSSLTVNGGIGAEANKIYCTSSLTIASQSFGKHMGRLTAKGGWACPGIGTDAGIPNEDFAINIYGGNITATGGEHAAGIGAGDANDIDNYCGDITITGGIITATGGEYAAGIGTGCADNHEKYYSNQCGNISITGGNIMATGGKNAAGIGTGFSLSEKHSNCYKSISITGGSIIATPYNFAGIETIGHGRGSNGGNITYGEGITHKKKFGANDMASEWVNLDYIDGKAASCEASGYKEAYYVPTSKKYYTVFPFNEDDLIGDETAYNTWKTQDGYIAPLEHFYSYTGSYDAATEIYTLKKVCSTCHAEAQEQPLTYSVPLKSYREYLVVTDKAYINTGYKPTSNTHAVMDVNVNGAVEYWFGMWNNNYNDGAFALGNDGGNVYAGYGNDGGGCGSSAVSNGRHTVELNKNTAYIDGNALVTLKISDAFTLDYPLYLFAQNRKGTAYIPDNQKITCYGFQILENDTLLHYYIPYAKDGVSGLFDLVGGEFFGNANTTGTMKADGYVISIEGEGTEESPHIIDSIEKLNLFKSYVNSGESYEGKYFKLTADIETPLTQSIGVWNDKPFKGIFDGDGHSITFTNTENTGNKGLFGYTVGAKISNLKVYGNIEGGWTLGGIVGCAKNTEIINCENHAAISWNENGNESYAGGIVGVSEGGNIISDCKNFAIVYGNHCVGGILGEAKENDTIKNCVNEGAVNGSKYAGGIVGSTVSDENGNVLVANCINYGVITATNDNAGGIAGNMSYCGTVKNCFTAAEVNGAGNSGIIVGWANRNFSIENSYYQTLDANSSLVAVKHDNGKTYSATAVSTADNADMIEAMNEKADENDGWYYWTVEDGRAWLTADPVKCDGISLTLSSDISINFYMELSDDARQNGTMTFYIGGRIVTLKGTDAKYNSTEKKYYFSTPLTVLEMAETVTTTFTYNGVDYVQEYSVEQYIDAILNGTDKDGKPYSDEMKLLARKIANYGYYAQIYLESIHTNVHIVDPYTEPEKGYDRVEPFSGEFDINTQKAIEALANYKVSVSGTSDNLSLYGSTVYFDSATALNYYVTVKNGVEPTATAFNTVTGKEKQVEIKLYKDNIYILSVKDITATELADDITVTIDEELAVTGSVFAYCNSVVKAHNFDGATEKDIIAVNAMAAFYEYYDAAVDYAKSVQTVYYDVTFDMDTHGEDITVQVKSGEKAEIPANPAADGYFFDGWYADEYRTIPWNFDTPITEDTTIYGKWISQEDYQKIVENAKSRVSDLRENAKSEIESLNLEDGKKQGFIAEVDKARLEAFSLIENAEYTDKIQSIVAEADNKIKNILHNAEAAVIKYTVSFDMMGHGEQVSSQKVKKGEYAELTVPEAEGYFFNGWFKDETLQDPWIFNTDTVNGDITLYADWRKIITVTFDMMGHGTQLGQLNAYEGYTFEAPIEPFDSSFKFEGWYKDRNFTEKWNFATEIVGDTDITLYAEWTPKQ